MELAAGKEAFDRFGTRLFAIANQPPERLRAVQEDVGDAITVLSDPDGSAIAAFGMTDPRGIPEPTVARAGTFLIDRNGVVAKRWLTENYRERPEPAEILRFLDRR